MTPDARQHHKLGTTLLCGGVFLLVCAGVIYATIAGDASKAAWPPFVFGAAVTFFGVMQTLKKPWALKMAIYSLVVAMFAFFARGLTNLIQVVQGNPDRLSLSVWGWLNCTGVVLTLFILFRQLKVKAPREKQ